MHITEGSITIYWYNEKRLFLPLPRIFSSHFVVLLFWQGKINSDRYVILKTSTESLGPPHLHPWKLLLPALSHGSRGLISDIHLHPAFSNNIHAASPWKINAMCSLNTLKKYKSASSLMHCEGDTMAPKARNLRSLKYSFRDAIKGNSMVQEKLDILSVSDHWTLQPCPHPTRFNVKKVKRYLKFYECF